MNDFDKSRLLTDYQIFADYLKHCFEVFNRLGDVSLIEEIQSALKKMGNIVNKIAEE